MSNYTEILKDDGTLLGYLPVSKDGGRLRSVIYMTESGAYEKPSWLKFAIVTVVGAGGGRGSIAATASGTVGSAGPGGGGGTAVKKIAASALSESETVTIGAGGASGGAAGANVAGGDGGASSFGTHCSATGGGGGGAGAVGTSATSNPGAAGVGTGGDFNYSGGAPSHCRAFYVSSIAIQVLTTGGPSFMGAFPAKGSGCSGSVISVSQPGHAGLAGAPGIVIVEEYE